MLPQSIKPTPMSGEVGRGLVPSLGKEGRVVVKKIVSLKENPSPREGKGWGFYFQYISVNSFLIFTSSSLKYLRKSPHVTSSISSVFRLTSIASNLLE